MTAAPLTRRVQRGRGHSYFLDGQPCPGVTSILNDGVPKPALIGWAANTTAAYAVDHWFDLGQLTTSERLKTLEKARFESSTAASARGTEIHNLAARLLLDQEIVIRDDVRGHVDSCLAFLEEWQPEELLVETVVLNRRWRYMGTLDLVARLNGTLYVLDWKTGTGIYPETALQLAAYANAETYLDGDGLEQPMPTIDAGAAVWLRPDGYDVVPLEIGPAVFRTFQYAAQVAQFTSAPREAYIGAAPEARGGRIVKRLITRFTKRTGATYATI